MKFESNITVTEERGVYQYRVCPNGATRVMFSNAHSVRETAGGQDSGTKQVAPMTPVPLRIRLIIAAIFIASCLLVFLPS